MPCQVDGKIETEVGKDRLITEVLDLQAAAEITVVTADFSHSCHKIAPTVVVPVPVVSGGMVIQWQQEMAMAGMAPDRERPENPEPNVN